MKAKLRALYAAALACEQGLPAYIEKLEHQRDRLQERVDNYDFKDYLTDRQEELHDEAEDKISELEDEIDTLEEVRESVETITSALWMGQFPDLDVIKQRMVDEFLAKYPLLDKQ